MADSGDGIEEFREQDRYLPIANVARIMKQGLPPNAKIAKDAKETVQECASEFITFVTSEASDKCSAEKRKTINGDDILWAMGTLGFDKYVDPLRLYLQKYRESVKGAGDRRRRDDMGMPHAHMGYPAPYGGGQGHPIGGDGSASDPRVNAAFADAAAAAASNPGPGAAGGAAPNRQ